VHVGRRYAAAVTVMVHGASGVVGEAVVRTLAATDEVRATVRRPETAERLRALGAKVAVRAIERPDDLAEILPRVHTLVHLVGGANQPDDDEVLAANHRSTLLALAAAREAGVRRVVLLSTPGADPDARDVYVRAKGLAEEAVAASGLEHAIVRAAPVHGLGGLWFTALVQGALADPPIVVGAGDREVAPLFADDLAAAVAAIDDLDGDVAGTWALEGPDVLRADDLVHLLRDDDAPVAHADGDEAAAALAALLDVPVSLAAVADLARAGRAVDAPDAAGAFGVARTGLREGLRRTLARAAP
jgi:NADH dehydrogenase